MALPQKDPNLEIALYSVGSLLMNTVMDNKNPVDLRLRKNISTSLLRSAGRNEISEDLSSLLDKISNAANVSTELENGDKKKYNDNIINLLENAVNKITGETEYTSLQPQLPLPELSKCNECSKDAKTPCENRFLISLYTDLAETVYPAKFDTRQKEKLDRYTEVLLQCKKHPYNSKMSIRPKDRNYMNHSIKNI